MSKGQEIRITDRWSVQSESDQWILIEYVHGVGRKGAENEGEPTVTKRFRFFPSLKSAVDRLVELSPNDADSVSRIVEALDRIRITMEKCGWSAK